MRERDRQLLHYRRGRTISGQANLERGDLRSLTRRRVGLIRLLSISVGVVVVAAVMISLSIHHQLVQLAGVEGGAIDANRYAELISNYFSERPFERFRPALNITTLNRFLQAQAPEIDSVQSIETNFLQATVVRLNVRKPVAMWESDYGASRSERSLFDWHSSCSPSIF